MKQLIAVRWRIEFKLVANGKLMLSQRGGSHGKVAAKKQPWRANCRYYGIILLSCDPIIFGVTLILESSLEITLGFILEVGLFRESGYIFLYDSLQSDFHTAFGILV